MVELLITIGIGKYSCACITDNRTGNWQRFCNCYPLLVGVVSDSIH